MLHFKGLGKIILQPYIYFPKGKQVNILNHIYIYTFPKENKLINCNQSGFTPGDSTINQLINICNKIHCQLDNDDEVLTVFFFIYK